MIWPSDLLFDPTWPILKNVQDFIYAKTLTKFHEYQTENLVSTAYTRFSESWPSDIIFDPTWPILELLWDFIKTKILTKFQTENVASRAYKRFF